MEENDIVKYVLENREIYEKKIGRDIPLVYLEEIISGFSLEEYCPSKDVIHMINELSETLLYLVLENVLVEEDIEEYAKLSLFLYNCAKLIESEVAERNIEIVNKVLSSSFSFFDMFQILRMVSNMINKNILASKIEHEAAHNFLSVIRGITNDRK